MVTLSLSLSSLSHSLDLARSLSLSLSLSPPISLTITLPPRGDSAGLDSGSQIIRPGHRPIDTPAQAKQCSLSRISASVPGKMLRGIAAPLENDIHAKHSKVQMSRSAPQTSWLVVPSTLYELNQSKLKDPHVFAEAGSRNHQYCH